MKAMKARLATFEAVQNFRDFGGYETESGGRLKSGRLFRSASFHAASEADIARLEDLGVAVVVDLRLPAERAAEPNRWPAEPARTITSDAPISDGVADDLPPHLRALMQDDVDAAAVERYMRGAYRAYPFSPRYAGLYRAWFEALAQNEGAAVIHCAAGKDRTGLGAALTLHALGVPEDAIIADYEFSNAALEPDARLPQVKARLEARIGRRIAAAALRPMLGVHADYIRAAHAAITERHGTVGQYLEAVLGVDAGKRAALRAKYST